jgi:hypothetical protein
VRECASVRLRVRTKCGVCVCVRACACACDAVLSPLELVLSMVNQEGRVV